MEQINGKKLDLKEIVTFEELIMSNVLGRKSGKEKGTVLIK